MAGKGRREARDSRPLRRADRLPEAGGQSTGCARRPPEGQLPGRMVRARLRWLRVRKVRDARPEPPARAPRRSLAVSRPAAAVRLRLQHHQRHAALQDGPVARGSPQVRAMAQAARAAREADAVRGRGARSSRRHGPRRRGDTDGHRAQRWGGHIRPTRSRRSIRGIRVFLGICATSTAESRR
jgi:hypothetical protein